MTALMGSRGTSQGWPAHLVGQPGRPHRRPAPALGAPLAVSAGFLAELYGMTPSEQRRHASGVLSRVVALRVALSEPEQLLSEEVTMEKPFLCRLGRHRWQRLRNPEGGWYRECRGCGKQRHGIGGPTSSGGTTLPMGPA